MGLFDKFRKKSTPDESRGWWPLWGWGSGSVKASREDLLSFHAVFACISLITKDVGKMPLQLKKKENDVWQEVKDNRFKFFEKPNHFQTMQQFIEYYIASKCSRGNTYVLKLRNAFGEVEQLVVLNPDTTKPLVSPSGDVFYKISIDHLAQNSEPLILPASEIIHDRWNCLFHPLVGISPLTACSLSAEQGIAIQKFGSKFFGNQSRPGGFLSFPGKIDEADAKKIQEAWQQNYSGENIGKTAVLGGDVKYVSMGMSATDAQLLEQHKWAAEICCSVFGMPPYKVGIGGIPSGVKPEDLERIYLNSCLQSLVEAFENCMDDAFDLKAQGLEVFLDLSVLLRMDSMSQMNYWSVGVKGGLVAPNEGRKALNLKPLPGGNTVYMQQQNYSLEALYKRDQKDDPFASGSGQSTGGDDGTNSE